MAITIVTTAASETANSYATLAEATTYFEAHPFSSVWLGLAADADRDKLLVLAARGMDRAFKYKGLKYDEDQALQFPRDIDEEATIKQAIKDAQCELLIFLYYDRDDTGLAANSQEIAAVEVFQTIKTQFRNTADRENRSTVAGASLEAVSALLRDWIVGGDQYGGSSTFEFSR